MALKLLGFVLVGGVHMLQCIWVCVNDEKIGWALSPSLQLYASWLRA